jgi:Clp amino terminal domain, pathogenicity island component
MQHRFDTESRIAVAQATDIARELGHQEVGPGHLLLGLLANPRGTAYAALWEHGIELETARDLVAQHHVEPEPETDEAAEPGREPDYAEDREALEAIGIDLDRVREAVRANLGADLAEGWARRGERGRSRSDRRRRRHHHRHHHDHDHEHEKGRGRRGPRSRRDDGPRFSRELRALLRDVRRATLHDRLEADDRDDARRVPGITGARLLVAMTRCDDPAVRAVLATSTGIDGLRAQAEVATRPLA